MNEAPTSWSRPYFQGSGGKPFLFYIIYGEFRGAPEIDAQEYRTRGIPPGLILARYEREKYPDVLAGFEEGYLWDELSHQDPDLARRVSAASECLILRGELDDQENLDYLRDSVGFSTYFLDHGGVCVYDPQMFRWRWPEAWRRHIFEPDGPVPSHHVIILTSDEDRTGAGAEPLTWFHTRGMRKFGRPDLSVHGVPRRHHKAILDLIGRFIELQAFGGIIAEGQEIRMRGLPAGMTCCHRGDLDDPDFNNVHVEITPPA